MVRWLALWVGAGCGGDAGPGDSASTEPACDIPTFDLPSLDCGQLLGVYDRLLDEASGCEVDDDCQVLDSRCDVLFVGACTVGANRCIDQGDIDEVVDAWAPCDDDPMSACPEPCEPSVARCDAGRCVAVLL